MSFIVFANPFAQQTAPQQSQPPQTQDTTAVGPAGGPSATGSTSDASTDSGSGSGQSSTSNQQNNAELVKANSNSAATRSEDATPNSVVNAQTQASTLSSAQIEARARRAALALMETARKDAILTRITTPTETPPVQPVRASVGMPDPLPTSPYLKPSTPG